MPGGDLSYKTVARKIAAVGVCRRLSISRPTQGSFQGSGWQRWLEVSAAVQDCKLASHARRATLNLQSARMVATAEVLSVVIRGSASPGLPMPMQYTSGRAGDVTLSCHAQGI